MVLNGLGWAAATEGGLVHGTGLEVGWDRLGCGDGGSWFTALS